MSRTTARAVAAVLAAVVLLAACGDDGPSTAEVLGEQIRLSDAFGELDLTVEGSLCASEAALTEIGEDEALALGLGEEEVEPDFATVPEAELGAVASAIDGCVDGLDRTLAAALADGITDEPDETLPVTDADAACVADALVGDFGVERLLVLGAVTGEGDPFAGDEIDEGEAERVADAFLGCLDIRSVFVEQFETDGVPADTAACLAQNIPQDTLRQLFTAQFAGRPVDPGTLLGPALELCGLG